jgi:hypothetical protein
MTNFANWSQKRFLRWLYKNYPPPPTRWVEVTLDKHHTPDLISKFKMADDYEICMQELAWELEMHHRDSVLPQFAEQPPEPWTLLIRPAKRRKKKQMWLHVPNEMLPNNDSHPPHS